MKAKFISKTSDNTILIEVDKELYDNITPDYHSVTHGQELRLHDYIPTARLYTGLYRDLRQTFKNLFHLIYEAPKT